MEIINQGTNKKTTYYQQGWINGLLTFATMFKTGTISDGVTAEQFRHYVIQQAEQLASEARNYSI